MHRGAGIFSGDKNVRLARFVRNKEAVTGLMDRQFAGDEVCLSRKHITILADARDLSGMFEVPEHLVKSHAHATLASERFSQLTLVQRPVVFASQQGKNLFPNFTSVLSHLSENILFDLIVDVTRFQYGVHDEKTDYSRHIRGRIDRDWSCRVLIWRGRH